MATRQMDAFGRMPVSDPVTLFDSSLQYNDQPLLWETVGDGTATHVPVKSAVQMIVTEGQSVIRQSRPYIRYQPGKSQLILMTGVLGAPTASVTKRIGYFDDDNGIYFELTVDGLFICKRSKVSGTVVSTRIPLSACEAPWPREIDDIDTEKAQIFFIDLEWLGVGSVRCGLVIDGAFHVLYKFNHANSVSSVYMTTANLPVRYEMVSATGSADDMYQICTSVQSEGGFQEELGFPFSANNGTTGIDVTTRRAILSIRPKGTFNSIVNRATIRPEAVTLYVTTAPALYEIVYGGTIGGTPVFTGVGDNSCVQYDTQGTTVSGGEVLESGYIVTGGAGGTARGGASVQLLSKLPLVLDSAGQNPIALSVVLTGIGGTATCYASMMWRELY